MPTGLERLSEQIQARRELPPPQARRALREAARLSRQAIGDAVGVTATAVFYWEHGTTEPRGENLRRYAEVLDLLRGAS